MYCKHCGKEVPDEFRYCVFCGGFIGFDDYTSQEKQETHFSTEQTNTQQPPNPTETVNTFEQGFQAASSPKSRLALSILAIFFGFIGTHRFYAGRIATGIIRVLVVAVLLIFFFLRISQNIQSTTILAPITTSEMTLDQGTDNKGVQDTSSEVKQKTVDKVRLQILYSDKTTYEIKIIYEVYLLIFCVIFLIMLCCWIVDATVCISGQFKDGRNLPINK